LGAIASLAMVCMISIVHTMPVLSGYLKMGTPDAYSNSMKQPGLVGKKRVCPNFRV
jgi:hypothetical protein